MRAHRSRSLVFTLLGIALAPGFASAQEPPSPGATPATTELARILQTTAADVASLAVQAELISHSLSEVVGTAISPLLGVGAIGVAGYYRADVTARAKLPWYNHPWCWGSIAGLLLLISLKDTVGSAVPLVKKPLDALELIENKVSALVAAPVVLTELVRRLTPVAEALVGQALAWIVPVAHAAAVTPTPGPAADSAVEILSIAVPATLATIIFFVVWLSGHVVNVLVFLNPLPFLDWLMKVARLALIGFVVGASALNPWLGIAVCLVIFAVSLWTFGWSFRLMTLGTVCSWDLLTRPTSDLAADDRFLAFAIGLPGLPARTLGHLQRSTNGRLEFVYRRLLVLPRPAIELPPARGRHEMGDGLLSPVLIDGIDAGTYRTLLRFAPRYRNGAAALGRKLGIGPVRDVSIARGVGASWRWLMGQLSDPSTPTRT